MLAAVALVAAAYAIGTFPTALLVGRRRGFDPTSQGSGNPGASNTTRVGGIRAGVLVLAGDLGKGAAAAGAGYAYSGRGLAWVAGAAAVAGHMWPATRRFRGGKGVATGAGVGLVCAPVAFAVLAPVFGLVAVLSRKAALGSIAIAVLLPVAVALLRHSAGEVAIAAAIAVAVVWRHEDNIRRLLSGTETGVR